jgi:GNAT superfamily N-acetyltransferase
MTDSKENLIRIVSYDSHYDDAFRELNYEWLEEFFDIEPYDRIVLGNPQKHIIDKGGKVFFALKGDEVVGTCALLKHADHKYELAKMGVAKSHQGEGIGRMLVEAAIEETKRLGATHLVLATSKLLTTANHLYERLRFRYVDMAEIGPIPYKRETIAMLRKLDIDE